MKQRHQLLLPSCVLILGSLLTGCTVEQTAVSPTFDGRAILGKMHGGQQPVVGAHVYVMAANTTGYGQPSVSLIQSGAGVANDATGNYVTTDSTGSFVLTGVYSCTPGALVYVLGTGGNPGNGSGNPNPALAMMAALGACPSGGDFSSATPYVYLNEVSTVASVYALAGFMTDGAHVSSSGTANALTGIGNAFATVANIENIATGTARTTTPNGNGTVAQSTINTLADILAPCVNSDGTGAGCSTLFTNAKNGSATPTDTITAMVNIAHHPGSNVAALFGLVNGTSPFSPVLGSAPNDLTISVAYTGGGMSQDYYAAADGQGNIWVMGQQSGISLFNNLGVAQNSSKVHTGLGYNFSLTLDGAGDAFVSNYGTTPGLVKVSPGLSVSGISTAGNMPTPQSAIYDGNGNIVSWNYSTENFGRVTTLLAANAPTGSLSGATISQYAALAIDNSGNIWATGTTPAYLQKFTSNGAFTLKATSGFSNPNNIAVDGSGQVWVVDQNQGLDGFTSSGVPLSGSPFTGGGLGGSSTSYSLAIDGDGNVWTSAVNQTIVSNPTPHVTDTESLAEFSTSGAVLSPAAGYQAAGLATGINSSGYPLTIDNSGNVWVANFGANVLTQFVGLAAPVYGPVTPGHLGSRP